MINCLKSLKKESSIKNIVVVPICKYIIIIEINIKIEPKNVYKKKINLMTKKH